MPGRDSALVRAYPKVGKRTARLSSPGRRSYECRFQYNPHLKPAFYMKSWCMKKAI